MPGVRFFYFLRNFLAIVHVAKTTDFWTASCTSIPTPVSFSNLQNDFGVQYFADIIIGITSTVHQWCILVDFFIVFVVNIDIRWK